MYKVFNNVEGINIFQGTERSFIEFMKRIAIENEDFDFSIIGIGDAEEYITNYCGNLDLTIVNLDTDEINKLKETHEKIRVILIENGCEEYGDCIIDEISVACNIQPTTIYYDED